VREAIVLLYTACRIVPQKVYNGGMIATLAAILVVFCILALAEYLSRTTSIHTELTRKLVHMSVGTFVAFWPFFLSWGIIETISLLFLFVVLLSIRLNIFRSIHAVQRNNTGEILFAMAIGGMALISSSKWIFTAAMLNLAIGDGMAAIVGTLYGDNNQYKVFKHTKSRAGSIAFFVCSELILIIYAVFGHGHIAFLDYVWMPLLATAAENLAVNGTDNIAVPVIVALMLSSSL